MPHLVNPTLGGSGNGIQMARNSAGQPIDQYEILAQWRGQLLIDHPKSHFKVFGCGTVDPQFGQGATWVEVR